MKKDQIGEADAGIGMFIFAVVIAVFLFVGEPDIHDLLVQVLQLHLQR